MGGYVVNFTVYTMAMLGLICFAVFVYKKVMEGNIRKDNTKFLTVEESMTLSPRKTLHIVRAGNERFLIAADVDRTTLISKLSGDERFESVKSFDRFLNTEKETLIDSVYPSSDSQVKGVVITEELPIQLEGLSSATRTLSRQNRPSMDKREKINKIYQETSSQNHTLMQEMAKKINEL